MKNINTAKITNLKKNSIQLLEKTLMKRIEKTLDNTHDNMNSLSGNFINRKMIIVLSNEITRQEKETIKYHIQKVIGGSIVKIIEMNSQITAMYSLSLRGNYKYHEQETHINDPVNVNIDIVNQVIEQTNPDMCLIFSHNQAITENNSKVYNFKIKKDEIILF